VVIIMELLAEFVVAVTRKIERPLDLKAAQ
jgi:hypothetical protein